MSLTSSLGSWAPRYKGKQVAYIVFYIVSDLLHWVNYWGFNASPFGSSSCDTLSLPYWCQLVWEVHNIQEDMYLTINDVVFFIVKFFFSYERSVYSVQEEKDLLEEKCCPIHRKPCILRKEDNFFFALSKYQMNIEELLSSNPKFVQPHFRLNEVCLWFLITYSS